MYRANVLLVKVQALFVGQDEDYVLVIASFGKLFCPCCWSDKIPDGPCCWDALSQPCTPALLFLISRNPMCGCSFPPWPVITTAAFDRIRARPHSEKPALAEWGATGLMQAVAEDVLSFSSRPNVMTVIVSSGLWSTHPRMTRLGVLFHECIITLFKEFIFQLMTGNFSLLFNLRKAKAKMECFTYLVTNWQNSCIWFPWSCLHHFEVAVGSLLFRTFPLQCTVMKICCAAVASLSYRIILVLRMGFGGKFSGAWHFLPKREKVLERERDGGKKNLQNCVSIKCSGFVLHWKESKIWKLKPLVKQNQV